MKAGAVDSASDAGALVDGARDLVAEAVRWMLQETETALTALAVLAAILLALSALRRLAAPSKSADDAPASLAGLVRHTFGHTKDWFLLFLAARIAAAWFAVPDLLARGIEHGFVIALVWQGAIWARGLALAMIARRAAAGPDDGQLATATGILKTLVTAFAFVVAFILMMDNLGANVTALVAGLGVGGIAIGLAAQGVLGDLFAALSIIFDRTFAKGDGISFDDVQGSVEDIGLKTTRIRAISGEEVIISNAKLLEKTVRNYSRLDGRRVTLNFGIVYGTPPDVVAGLPELLRGIVEASPERRFVRAAMTGFGDSALQFMFVFDVASPDFDQMVMARHEVAVSMLRIFQEQDIAFAYPTQLQLTAGADGKPIDPRDIRAA